MGMQIDGGKRDLLFFIERARMSESRYPGQPVSLANYEILFYAVATKLRELEEDLVLRLKNGFVNESTVLHHRGEDCNSNSPFTVIDFFRYVVAKWILITNESLVVLLHVRVWLKNYLDRAFSYDSNRLLIPGYIPGVTSAEEWSVLRSRYEMIYGRAIISNPQFPVQGLEGHRQKSVAMIMGELNERYAPQLEQAKQTQRCEVKEQEVLSRRTEAARYMALKNLVGKGDTSAEGYEEILDVLASETRLTCKCGPGCVCAEFCRGGRPVDCVCSTHTVFSRFPREDVPRQTTPDVTPEQADFFAIIAEMEKRVRKAPAVAPTPRPQRKEMAGVGKAALQHAIQRKARAAAAAVPKIGRFE